MILEFEQGVIKVIPGLEKSSVTIRTQESNVVIEADGSITINNAKEVQVSGNVSRYSDPDYLKTLGPITAQSVTGSGLLMNGVAQTAMVSSLDSARESVVTPKQTRIYDGDELVAVSGGLEKVDAGTQQSASMVIDSAFVEAHKGLLEHGGYAGVYPEWQDDPVAKLYKGTLKAKTAEEKEVDLFKKLDELYPKVMLSDDPVAIVQHCLEYLELIGEDVVAICEKFDPSDVGPMSSYMKAMVQAHRVGEEEKFLTRITEESEAFEARCAETDAEYNEVMDKLMSLDLEGNFDEYKALADRSRELVMYRMDGVPMQEVSIGETAEELAKPFQKSALDGVPFGTGLEDEDFHVGVPLMTEEQIKEAIDLLQFDDIDEEDLAEVGDLVRGIMKELGLVIENGEVETPPIQAKGAPVTEESVRSALDALGLCSAARFNDEDHPIARGFWEGIDKVVGRGYTTVEDRLKRTAKVIDDYAARAEKEDIGLGSLLTDLFKKDAK